MPKGQYDHQARFDLTGQVFGDWTVLTRGRERGQVGRYWLCRCICGVEREVFPPNLRSGRSKGCGCRFPELAVQRFTTHGESHTSENNIWRHMRHRCTNPNNTKWELYGGRGITVDPRWDNFETFLHDVGPRPDKSHTLERRDGNLGYSPENCYWATITQQNRNRNWR